MFYNENREKRPGFFLAGIFGEFGGRGRFFFDVRDRRSNYIKFHLRLFSGLEGASV